MEKPNKTLKEKLVGVTGSFSGVTSFLGSYQVCHNLCMSLVALLGLIGITVAGMPLLFLTTVAVPFWIAAVVLFLITLIFYFTKKCISHKQIIFNSGLIIAGVPFQSLQRFNLYFWIVGGALVLISAVWFVKDKFFSKK